MALQNCTRNSENFEPASPGSRITMRPSLRSGDVITRDQAARQLKEDQNPLRAYAEDTGRLSDDGRVMFI